MTTEEKAKAYDEALEWIRKVYPTLTGAAKEDAEHYFPELKESEDEMIRKKLINLIKELASAELPIMTSGYFVDGQDKNYIAWLEKQKNTISSYEEKLDRCVCENFNKGVREVLLHPEEYGLVKQSEQEEPQVYETEDGETITYSETEGYRVYDEKQKEQKPVEWSDTDKIGWDEAFACVTRAEKAAKNEEELQNAVTAEKWLKEIKFKYCVHPVNQEWSEEDENKLNHILEIVHIASGSEASVNEKEELESFLKSLRPQPHKETYQAAKHDLATEFMNYLDNNKPEGKMCLSNGECEDIDKAFKENDWAKIIRYAEKYQIQQKPEVKHIGWVARDSEYNPYFGLGLVLFKGKPIRSGDCWTGVIDSQLPWESFPDLKWKDEPIEVEVEVTIRKKIDINSI